MTLAYPVILFFVASVATTCNGENASVLLLADTAEPDFGRVKNNLRNFFDFVYQCPEFHSTDFVFASATTGRFDGWINGYLSEKRTTIYRVKLKGNFASESFRHRSRLTWIILTETVDVGRYGGVNLWNAMNNYVVIFVGDCGEEVNGIFDFLWSRYSVSGVMLASLCDKFSAFLKYLPFEKSPQGFYGVVERTEMRNDPRMGGSMQPRLFESFENLNGYPLKVCVFSSTMFIVARDRHGEITLSGAEARMVWSIRRGLNATFELDDAECTSGYSDPFQAALASLADRTTDLILTGYFEKPYDGLRSSYEFTTASYQDKLCLIVPTSGQIPEYLLPVMPFSSKFWPVLIFYIIAMKVLRIYTRRTSLALINRTREDFRSRETEPETPIDRLNAWVQRFFPSTVSTALPERLLVTSILLASVVFLGCYESGLTAILSMSSVRKSEINTLEEFADSDFLIYSRFENLLNSIFNDDSPIMNKLKSKIRVSEPNNQSLTEIAAYHKNITTVERISSLDVNNVTKFYDRNGNFLLHLVQECPAQYMVAYVVRQASPLLKRLNIIILRIEEAGLHEKWILDDKFTSKLDNAKHFPKVEKKTVLTLKHFMLAFIALFVGLSGSLFIFIFEKYYHRKKKKV